MIELSELELKKYRTPLSIKYGSSDISSDKVKIR